MNCKRSARHIWNRLSVAVRHYFSPVYRSLSPPPLPAVSPEYALLEKTTSIGVGTRFKQEHGGENLMNTVSLYFNKRVKHLYTWRFGPMALVLAEGQQLPVDCEDMGLHLVDCLWSVTSVHSSIQSVSVHLEVDFMEKTPLCFIEIHIESL